MNNKELDGLSILDDSSELVAYTDLRRGRLLISDEIWDAAVMNYLNNMKRLIAVTQKDLIAQRDVAVEVSARAKAACAKENLRVTKEKETNV